LLCFFREEDSQKWFLPMRQNIFEKERREFPRQSVNEEAEFLIPAENMRLPCIIANISATGAKIVCDAIPPQNSKVVLFIRGGLSIEAVTGWYKDGQLGLRFTTPQETSL
jgi:PilZ domain